MNKKKIIIIVIIIFVILSIAFQNNSEQVNSDNIKTENNEEENINKNEGIVLKFGELLDFKETCTEYDEELNCLNTTAIIKAKIESSYSNAATIDQNYYNIENFIKNNDCSKYSEIQYWAVADMSNGEESKVISFTVSNQLIDKIKNEKIVANQLENYVDDLWILPSLEE